MAEVSKEELWREEELIRAGYSSEEAKVLAMCRDIDLHYAIWLVRERGCDPSIAFMILV